MKDRFLFQGLVLGGALVARQVVQNAYTSRIAPAYEGMIADSRDHDIVSFVVETAAGIGFGKVCVIGTTEKQARVAEAARGAIGISEAAHFHELGHAPSELWPQYSNIPIVKRGPIWVMASVAVAPETAAYFVPATGVLTNVSAGNTLIGRWETSTAGAGLAVLNVIPQAV